MSCCSKGPEGQSTVASIGAGQQTGTQASHSKADFSLPKLLKCKRNQFKFQICDEVR